MTVYDFKARTMEGSEVSLSEHRDKVMLIVNVASRCVYTPQYEGLEKLYRKHQEQGFVVLGFPCNQFGKQEPGSEAEIRDFCRMSYAVSFPIFSKIEVNGPQAHPLYQYLTKAKPGILGTRKIKWNFTKFLVSRHGEPLRRYAPKDDPSSLEADIQRALEGVR